MPYFREEDKKTKDNSWSDEAHAVLVLAIQTIDDHFYARKQPKEILELREALDKILNHSDELNEGSDMELTKIKFISPKYAYVKNAR